MGPIRGRALMEGGRVTGASPSEKREAGMFSVPGGSGGESPRGGWCSGPQFHGGRAPSSFCNHICRHVTIHWSVHPTACCLFTVNRRDWGKPVSLAWSEPATGKEGEPAIAKAIPRSDRGRKSAHTFSKSLRCIILGCNES